MGRMFSSSTGRRAYHRADLCKRNPHPAQRCLFTGYQNAHTQTPIYSLFLFAGVGWSSDHGRSQLSQMCKVTRLTQPPPSAPAAVDLPVNMYHKTPKYIVQMWKK